MTKMEELEDLLVEENIELDYFPFGKAKACIIEVDGIFSIAIDISQVESSAEMTMLLTHEVAHYMTGSLYGRQLPIPNRVKYEDQAWRWAVNYLIDFEQLKELLQEGHDVYFIADYMDLCPEVVARAIEMRRDEWVLPSEL